MPPSYVRAAKTPATEYLFMPGDGRTDAIGMGRKKRPRPLAAPRAVVVVAVLVVSSVGCGSSSHDAAQKQDTGQQARLDELQRTVVSLEKRVVELESRADCLDGASSDLRNKSQSSSDTGVAPTFTATVDRRRQAARREASR